MQMQKNSIQCQICGQSIPETHAPIHKVRCSFKKESTLFSHSNKSSIITRGRKNKIFSESKNQIKQESQEKIPCPFCGYMQTLEELDSHPNKCPGKQSSCPYCGDSYPNELLQEHQTLCQRNPHHDNEWEDSHEQGNGNTVDRLMELIQLLNGIRMLVRNFQGEEEGLSPQKFQKLKKYKYKPSKEDELCTICYCKFQKAEDVMQLRCKHIYHTECISKWLQKSCKCPVCKHDQNKSR